MLCIGISAVQATPAPDGNSVLILDSTVIGGASSLEASKATDAGFNPVVISPAQWAVTTAADFSSFRALILGDAHCSGLSAVSAAIANRSVWGPTITGNVVIIGTDPEWHKSIGGGQLTESAIAFSADEATKTGLMATLSCYYGGVSPGTPVPLLDELGSFTVRGVGCYNDAHIVATHDALGTLTDADLSNWTCSVHEAFDGFPSDFIPLAIAQGITTEGSLTFADDSFGVPYILARGEDLSPIACGNGVIEAPEQCDDGNTASGDGCSSLCTLEANTPPVCSGAAASPSMLWPPNHKMQNITIEGVTDADTDPLVITIDSVTQDESTTALGSGGKAKSPDASINGDGTVDVRSEREGGAPHNGRVYSIDFTATDPENESCSNTVSICVPHDKGNGNTCIDDGQDFDSTTVN